MPVVNIALLQTAVPTFAKIGKWKPVQLTAKFKKMAILGESAYKSRFLKRLDNKILRQISICSWKMYLN